MPKIEFDQRALNITIMNFKGTKKNLMNAQKVAVALAGEQYRKAVIQNLSVPAIGGSAASHAKALAAPPFKHPYARRWPSIMIRPSGGYPGFERRELLVHSVSGRLRRAIKGSFEASGPAYKIDIDSAIAPHAKYVFFGTQVMHARDVFGATADDKGLRKALMVTIIRVFGEMFRTGAGIRVS